MRGKIKYHRDTPLQLEGWYLSWRNAKEVCIQRHLDDSLIRMMSSMLQLNVGGVNYWAVRAADKGAPTVQVLQVGRILVLGETMHLVLSRIASGERFHRCGRGQTMLHTR